MEREKVDVGNGRGGENPVGGEGWCGLGKGKCVLLSWWGVEGERKRKRERVEREEGGHGVQIEESRKDEIRQEVQDD